LTNRAGCVIIISESEREEKEMKKTTIYTVIRIDKWVEFKTIMTDVHIYTNQSSNKERIIEYAKKIKRTYPNHKIAVVSKEKAKELKTKCHEYYKEKERLALAELEKKSKDILLRQTVYNTFKK
jgi:hypothetical protein